MEDNGVSLQYHVEGDNPGDSQRYQAHRRHQLSNSQFVDVFVVRYLGVAPHRDDAIGEVELAGLSHGVQQQTRLAPRGIDLVPFDLKKKQPNETDYFPFNQSSFMLFKCA
jgi:hypothetical protein